MIRIAKLMTLAAVAGIALGACAATSTPRGFTDDLDIAMKRAKANGRNIVAVFSGSDWCAWCKLLERGFLSKDAFLKPASRTFELVFIDSPKDTSVLSESARKKNPKLMQKYGISEFPTILALDSAGGVITKINVRSLTPEALYGQIVEDVKKAMSEKKAPEKRLPAAQDAKK